MVSLGAVLEQFPDEVVTYVTDPRTGIQRHSKWPPALSEVIEACEQHQDHLAKLRKQRPAFQERKPEPLLRDRPQGYLANIFVPEGHPRYEKLVEWTKEAEPMWWKYGNASDGRRGLWVSRSAWEGTPEITLNPIMDEEMMKALEADGEKLRQLTGEDHGPVFLCSCQHPSFCEEYGACWEKWAKNRHFEHG